MYTWRSPRNRPLVTQFMSPYDRSSEWMKLGLLAAVTARFSRPSLNRHVEAMTYCPPAPSRAVSSGGRGLPFVALFGWGGARYAHEYRIVTGLAALRSLNVLAPAGVRFVVRGEVVVST